MIFDPTVGARGVEVDVRTEVGRHECLSEEAGAEVRHDDRQICMGGGDRVEGKRIAEPNVESAWQPKLLSRADG